MKLALEALTHIHDCLVISDMPETLLEQVGVEVVIHPCLFESSGGGVDSLSGYGQSAGGQ